MEVIGYHDIIGYHQFMHYTLSTIIEEKFGKIWKKGKNARRNFKDEA